MEIYHVTTLSNFARAYDKYARVYDKSAIPESTYPGSMFVLLKDELFIGINKTAGRILRSNIPDDRILIMRSEVDESLLRPNDITGTGLGLYIKGDRFPVKSVMIDFDEVSIEEAYARSLMIHGGFKDYEDLSPRSLSWLPVAQACQAKCRFCFSEASVSSEQEKNGHGVEHLPSIMREAASRGAKRFVITGGGEPTLMNHSNIVRAISYSLDYFDKTILITNGIQIAKKPQIARDYANVGLDVVAISRHHYDPAVNQFIMGLDTQTEKALENVQAAKISSRLICVLQKGGIDSAAEIENYLNWASEHQVNEVCFKELYVSTTLESVYAGHVENQYCEDNQVSLSTVLDAMTQLGFREISKLPWGSPVFEGEMNGHKIKVAAYTEPSMFWEKSNGVARSWNIMSDGQVLASLEDPNSNIEIGDLCGLC